MPKTLFFISAKGRLGSLPLVVFVIDRLAILLTSLALGKLLNFAHFAEFQKVFNDDLLLEIGEGLSALHILGLLTLVVSLGADTWEDASTLNALLETAKDREVVLVWVLCDFDIDGHVGG